MASSMKYVTLSVDISFTTVEKKDKTLEFTDIVCVSQMGENKTMDVTITAQHADNPVTGLVFRAQIITANNNDQEYCIALCGTKMVQRTKLLKNVINMNVELAGTFEIANALAVHKNTFNEVRDDEIRVLKKENEHLKNIIKVLVTPTSQSLLADHNAKQREALWKQSHPINVYDTNDIMANVTRIPVFKVNNTGTATCIVKPMTSSVQYSYTTQKPANSVAVIRKYDSMETLAEAAAVALKDDETSSSTQSTGPIKKRKVK